MAYIDQNRVARIDGTIRILLVDDSGSVRRALRRVLSTEPDLCVIGEAAGGEQAIRLAHEHHPDIVLMDLDLPDMNGLDASRRIKAAGSMCAIIMLTAWGNEAIRSAATRAGIALFIEKGEHLGDLAGTIRALYERNMPPESVTR